MAYAITLLVSVALTVKRKTRYVTSSATVLRQESQVRKDSQGGQRFTLIAMVQAMLFTDYHLTNFQLPFNQSLRDQLPYSIEKGLSFARKIADEK